MSFQALGWACAQKVTRAADKLVLIALSDRHNTEDGAAYPSLAWLCEFTSLDRKTVIAAIERLQAAGLIADTGERKGRTGQVKVYRLAVGAAETEPKPAPLKSAEKGLPKTEPFPSKGAVFPIKESQKRYTDTVMDTARKKDKPSSESARATRNSHGTRLPDDWQPPLLLPAELMAAVQAWPPGMLARERSRFKNYWTSKTGAGARKANWNATYVNWLWKADEDLSRDQDRYRNDRRSRGPTDGFARAARGLMGLSE